MFVATSEIFRKQFSDQLRQEVSRNEEIINSNMQNLVDIRLNKIQYGLVQEKLLLLFESVEGIGTVKKLEDKYEIKVDYYENLLKVMREENQDLKQRSKDQSKELDLLKKDLKDLIDRNIKLQGEKNLQYA